MKSHRELLEALRDSVANLDFDEVQRVAEDAMRQGVDPVRAVTRGLAAGLAIVGEKFEKKEYFLSELVVAAEVMKIGMGIIQPHIRGERTKTRGRILLATVRGDNHDIGKSLVATLLRANGFDVIDMGVDVPTEAIVEAVREKQPQVLGLSALLTVTMPEMEKVVEGLRAVDLRKSVKVIVGGSPVTREFAEKIGADYRAADAVDGVNKCVEWVSSREA
jgi:5-methyltetrahydrofolate--homocysteine methyltransferase